MLILSRKIDQSIIIGENIEISLTKIEGDSVKIGISAPRSIAILRKEILEEMQSSNKAAAAAATPAKGALVANSAKQLMAQLKAKKAEQAERKNNPPPQPVSTAGH
jgi:carbon storage regulator